MTPAQPALDAMMEGVTAGPWSASPVDPRRICDHRGLSVARAHLLGNYGTIEEAAANAAFIAAARELVPALAAKVRAQRETIAGLTAERDEARRDSALKHDWRIANQRTEIARLHGVIAGLEARVEALTGALHAAPNPSKFGAGIAEYQRLAEALQDWRQDHVRAAISGDTPDAR
jgi:hypothetical protein